MKKIIVANWKMNPLTLGEAERLFVETKKTSGKLKKTETVICPPFVYLAALNSKLKASGSKLSLGAQDVFYESKGAFTGEISPLMLKKMGVKYVIIGHSEKRESGDTNETINKKVKAALGAGLKVILCVGEKERDTDGAYLFLIKNQILSALKDVSKNLLKNFIITYEPIWAISSNKNATADTPDSSFHMSIFIRRMFLDIAGHKMAKELPILYGGSVNQENIGGFLKEGGVVGAIVGNQSLSAKNFGEILRIAEKC